MTEQKPTYDVGQDFGGELAKQSEFRPGEQAAHTTAGELQTGEVLHVSNGPGGQLYVIENEETGFPEFVPASEIAAPVEQKKP